MFYASKKKHPLYKNWIEIREKNCDVQKNFAFEWIMNSIKLKLLKKHMIMILFKLLSHKESSPRTNKSVKGEKVG